MLEVTEGWCPWRHILKNISQLGIHICTVRRGCHVFMPLLQKLSGYSEKFR